MKIEAEKAHIYNRELIKRKTITRGGEEIKNVQITHIICSSKPTNFHIIENLSANKNNTNNIPPNSTNKVSKSNKEKKEKSGISFYSSSCQSYNKVDKCKNLNLKGKTTVYQHCRRIGMTNDKRRNINSLYYNSEIKKLEPIKKEKEIEKVEYIQNFRSSKSKKSNNNDKNKITKNNTINKIKSINNNIKNNAENKTFDNNSKKNIQYGKGKYQIIDNIILLLLIILVIAV
jgi:hypothetical protein